MVHRRELLLARLRERGALALEVSSGAVSPALGEFVSADQRAESTLRLTWLRTRALTSIPREARTTPRPWRTSAATGRPVGETKASISPATIRIGNGPQQQLHGFRLRSGQRISPRQYSGKQEALRDPKSRAARDEDGRQFEHPVGRDEAPQLQAHAREPASHADDAHQQAVECHHVDGAQTRR